MLGETLSDRRSRAMPSPGVVKGAPSFTIQNTTQTASNVQGNYTLKNYKLTLQNGIHEQKFPWGQLEPSGKVCPSKGYRWRNPREMANSRGLAYYNNYTTSPFPRESYQGSDTYVMGACHLLWPNELRALYDLGRWLDSPGRQRGYSLAQRDSSNS